MMGPDGTNVKNQTEEVVPEHIPCGGPAWSRDGERIAFLFGF